MITIHFHSTLQKYTEQISSIELNIDTFSSIKDAICLNFPKLAFKFFKSNDFVDGVSFIYNKTEIVPLNWFLRDTIPEVVDEIWIIPCLQGSGGRAGKILIGGALIAASFAFPGPQSAAAASLFSQTGILASIGKALLGTGINLILSALFIKDMSKPKPEAPTLDSEQRKNNDMFDALQNTIDNSIVVPLHYGLIRVGGQLVSGYVKTVTHNKEETVIVGNYF